MKIYRLALTVSSVLLFSLECFCAETESKSLMDNETVQNFMKQLVGLLNQGSSGLLTGLNGYQDTDSYQRPFSDYSGLDYPYLDSSQRPGSPFYNRPYRPNFGRPGAPGRPEIYGLNQQGQLGSLLGLLGQGGTFDQNQFGSGLGSQNNFGQLGLGGNFGQFGSDGVENPVPYPYPPKPPTQRPYPPLGSYQQQSLFGALYSISQYDDLRCVPRLLCEVTAGSNPGGSYYPTYGQNQQTSIVPFLSKDALLTVLTVLNFVDESPVLVFGRAALLGYTARGDPRQCLTAYPLCPRNPDQLVDYLNNHNGGFFRFFNQQLNQIPQYAPYYQNNYKSENKKEPYRKFKKFTKLYDTENGKKYPQQYADKNQKYYKEPRILYGKETDNKITFDTLPQEDFNFNPGQSSENSGLGNSFQNIFSGNRGGKKLKFEDESDLSTNKVVLPEHSELAQNSNFHHAFFPAESQSLHSFSFPTDTSFTSDYHSNRTPKLMAFPDKTGTGNLVLEVDKFGNYFVRKDREEPLLESVNKIRFLSEESSGDNKHNKRHSKRLYFPEENKSLVF